MKSAPPVFQLTSVWLTALFSLLALVASAQTVTHLAPDGKPHKFELRDKQFFLDGESTLLVAGEMHFGRVLPEDWDTRLAQAKAMGLNTVSFYLFWNLCEPQEGKFDFSGLTDVRRMLQLCQKHGLWVILRPGPYCCAEVEYGGLPWWTAKHPDVKIRTNDPTYLAWCRRYLAAVGEQVADLQVTRGGPLLMVQMENEFSMVGRGDNSHLRALQGIFRDAGFDVPLFTCDPFLMPERDPATRLTGVLRGRNGLRADQNQTGQMVGIFHRIMLGDPTPIRVSDYDPALNLERDPQLLQIVNRLRGAIARARLVVRSTASPLIVIDDPAEIRRPGKLRMEIMMGVAGAAVHEHERRPHSFLLAIQLTVADVDPRLFQVKPVAPARHLRDLQHPFLFQMHLAIQN